MGPTWVPAVLGVHAVLYAVVVGTSALLFLLSGADGGEPGLPPSVRPVVWAVTAAVVGLTVHLVGRRDVAPGAYWPAALTGWLLVPLTWVGVVTWTRSPGLGWVTLVVLVNPFVWVLAVPLLGVGAAVHGCLLRRRH